MHIDNKPLDLKVACMFTQKSWCHFAMFQVKGVWNTIYFNKQSELYFYVSLLKPSHNCVRFTHFIFFLLVIMQMNVNAKPMLQEIFHWTVLKNMFAHGSSFWVVYFVISHFYEFGLFGLLCQAMTGVSSDIKHLLFTLAFTKHTWTNQLIKLLR